MNTSSAKTPPTGLQVECERCSLYLICAELAEQRSAPMLWARIHDYPHLLERGEHLFQSGDPFTAIYAVRSGAVKIYSTENGEAERIVGFATPGELLGTEAIRDGAYPHNARALRPSVVCELPFARAEEMMRRIGTLGARMFRVLSGEVARTQLQLLLLNKRTAEGRVAGFLLDLRERQRRHGLPAQKLELAMSRQDIANFLGLATETVCRMLTRFEDQGWVRIRRREVELVEPRELAKLTDGWWDA